MNYLLLISGIIAFFACIGHFTMGAKEYLKPILKADIEKVPQKVMQSVFHYMSVFMVLTTVALILFSLGVNLFFKNIDDVVKIIGIIYLKLKTRILEPLSGG